RDTIYLGRKRFSDKADMQAICRVIRAPQSYSWHYGNCALREVLISSAGSQSARQGHSGRSDSRLEVLCLNTIEHSCSLAVVNESLSSSAPWISTRHYY